MTYTEAHKRATTKYKLNNRDIQNKAVIKYRENNLEKCRTLSIIANKKARESNPEKFKEYERKRYLWKAITQTFRNILIE